MREFDLLVMDINDFNYRLPEELIAQSPLPNRDRSRLLWRDHFDGCLRKGQFRDILDLLRPGDLLVANDTQVVTARLEAHKPTGGKVEILLERILSSEQFLAQLRANRPISAGQVLRVAGWMLTVEKQEGRFYRITTDGQESVDILFQDYGRVPLPPYIRRQPAYEDRERYQTVYSAIPGAVAAPTAGLHFTQNLLHDLTRKNIGWATVTLHVGAGTFLPVQVNNLESHRMHAEWIEVSEETCKRIRQTVKRGGRVVAVGTTVVRALETAALRGELLPFSGDTNLYIQPGFRFTVTDVLITNFHLPKSTLLVLVSAFSGYDSVMEMYHYAVKQRFRFFSYGDAMMLDRMESSG